jgi:uncharacterized protein (DUF58 family)
MPIEQTEIQAYNNLELIARQVVEGFLTGLHKSPFHGFSVEFAEHRIYNTGESTRYIDWKLFGRSDKLYVKRFEEETNLRCQILIDNSSSMYYPEGENNKMKFSVYAAAAIIHLLKKQRDAFGLSVFSDEVSYHSDARSSMVQQKLIWQELEKLMEKPSKQATTNVANALHQIAESVHKRSMVVIFSDMMGSSGSQEEDIFNALQHLKYNKHEVMLFHVVDKSKELDFDFEGRPYEFIDVETGQHVKVHSNAVKDAYRDAVQRYTVELKSRCAQYKIDFIEADISQGFRQVLTPYLVKRERMVR